MEIQDIELDGKKIRFSLEPYFGSYNDVRKQIEEDGLRPATFREVVALLFGNQGDYKREQGNVIRAFRSGHPLFGFTALEKRFNDDKYSLIEQDNPKFKGQRLIQRADARVMSGKENNLREEYYASLGKSNWINITSNRSWLYNSEPLAVIPIVDYKIKVDQLSFEERYPYTDDQGRDRAHVTPATYSEEHYNIFSEAKLENGKLYSNNLPLRAVSFGIKESKSGGND